MLKWRELRKIFSFLGKGFLLFLAFLILFRLFIAEPFIVRGNSMEPSFSNGDYLWIEKITPHFKLQRGEVIVFQAPDNPYAVYIKRIIALPHERVRILKQRIYISSEEGVFLVREPYIRVLTQGSVDITLGENEYFVLGDNRTVSEDSRVFGPINKKAIVGRVWLRLLPVSQRGFIYIPSIILERVEEISDDLSGFLKDFSQFCYPFSLKS